MSTEAIIAWILGSSLTCIGTGVAAYLSLVQRVTRVEVLIELIGSKAAKILHSPHTPELDVLLERFADPDHELTAEEWMDLHTKCTEIEANLSVPKQERTLAAIIAAICVIDCKQCQGKRRPNYEHHNI